MNFKTITYIGIDFWKVILSNRNKTTARKN